jgi:hypothetical protein
MTKKKQPTDLNQLAHSIMRHSTGQLTEKEVRSQVAKLLGRLGGLKGGKARHKALSSERRKEIAKKGAEARWKKR